MDDQGTASASIPEEVRFRQEKVGALCRTDPKTAPPSLGLDEALELLKGDSGGCVVVVEEAHPSGAGWPRARRKVVGILTERDYIDKVAERFDFGRSPELRKERLSAYMTPAPQTLRSDQTLDEAIALMTSGGYRHLPLVDGDGMLAGVLSVRDIIQFLAEFFPTEVMNLPPILHAPVEDREGE